MRLKAGRIFLTAGIVLLLVFGCRKRDTPVDILKEAVENCNQAESFSGNLDMNIGAGIGDASLSLKLDMEVDMDVEAVRETGAYHMKGDIKTGIIGLTEEMEIYGVPDEKGSDFVTYAKYNDSWVKEKYPLDEKKAIGNLMNLENYFDSGSKFEMEEDEKENGKEVYVVTTTAEAKELDTAGVILDSFFGEDGISLDFGEVQSRVIFKIYKDSRYPASVSMVISGKDGDALSIIDEGEEVFTIRQMDFTVAFDEFDSVDEIKVPDEALEARADSLDIMDDLEKDDEELMEEDEPELPKDKDGNYILTNWEGDMEVSISKPEGMTVDQYSDETYLCFYKGGEKSYSASYTLDTLYEEEDEAFYIGIKTSMKDNCEEMEGYSDVNYREEKEITAGERKIKYASLSYTYLEDVYVQMVWAWTVIDGKYLLTCEFNEYPETKGDYAVNEEIIQKHFENIMD